MACPIPQGDHNQNNSYYIHALCECVQGLVQLLHSHKENTVTNHTPQYKSYLSEQQLLHTI